MEEELMDQDECELCGEPKDGDMGTFVDADRTEQVWAHAGCGEDAGLDLS